MDQIHENGCSISGARSECRCSFVNFVGFVVKGLLTNQLFQIRDIKKRSFIGYLGRALRCILALIASLSMIGSYAEHERIIR